MKPRSVIAATHHQSTRKVGLTNRYHTSVDTTDVRQVLQDGDDNSKNGPLLTIVTR